MKKIILLLPLLVLFSCSMQKRKYQKGYYVDWSSKRKNSNEQHVADRNARSVKPDQSTPVEIIKEQVIRLGDKNKFADNEIRQAFKKLNPDSCDEIVFRDGTKLKAKIFEISSSAIKYKRCGMEEGPTYVAKRSEVFMIRYANGTREVFKDEAPAVTPSQNSQQQQNQPNTNTYNKNLAVVHPFAVAAFVIGLLSLILLLLSFSSPIAFILLFVPVFVGGILSTRFGKRAAREISSDSSRYFGRGLALTGRIFGIIILSVTVPILALFLLILLLAP